MNLTLGAALIRASNQRSEGIRLWDREERETLHDWASLFVRAARVAGALRQVGVRPGDTVALVFPTGAAFFHAFFGVTLAGAIPVPLYPPVRLGRLEEYHARTAAMLTASRARLVLCERRTWRILGESVNRARPELGAHEVEHLDAGPIVVDRTPDDIAFVQFSSGTTVDPKPVALSHRASLGNAAAILQVLERTPEERHGASWLPLYHDMGLVGCVFPALIEAANLTLLAPEHFLARPGAWLRAISRSGAFVSPAPNFAYALCADRVTDAELDGVDLSRWRCALNGAEPVSPATLRRFVERFVPWGLRPSALTPVYGLAEASLAVTFSAVHQPFSTRRFDRNALADGRVVPHPDGVELVSVGRPLPDTRVEAPTDAVGPVRISGPGLMTGYLHQPERTAAVLADGWLDTGDLGFLHEGELFLTGRVKDILVLRGQNHAPHELEQAVDAVEGVRVGCAAAVSWRPEDAEVERLVVFVEVREAPDGNTGSALLEAGPPDRLRPVPGMGALADRCAAAILAATGLDPDAVVLLPPGTLPRTSSGKIRRSEALRRWLAGELVPPGPVNAWTLGTALVRGTLAHWKTSLGR